MQNKGTNPIKNKVILNSIQDLQRLPLPLINNMRRRFQIKFGMIALCNKQGFTQAGFLLHLREKVAEGRMRGHLSAFTARAVIPQACSAGYSGRFAFTLIELLVVVLIIGILTAVAVPQYQKAVYRSRYATLKNLVKSLAAAQEVYYLANGQYAEKFIDLDIDMPGGKTADSTDAKYIYDWGYCSFETGEWSAKASCTNKKIHMAYQQYFLHVKGSSLARVCTIDTTTAAPVQHKICQAETNRSTNSGGGAEAGYFSYRY